MYSWKKCFWILPCCAMIFLFSGCKKMASGELNIEKKLESDAIITEKDKKYEAHIVHIPEGITSISFKSPENLVGTTFEHKDGKYIVSNRELSGEYNINPLEKNSAFCKIMGVLNTLSNIDNLKIDSKDDEKMIFKVNFENSEYKVLTSKEGKILSIENEAENFKSEFVE